MQLHIRRLYLVRKKLLMLAKNKESYEKYFKSLSKRRHNLVQRYHCKFHCVFFERIC